VTERLNQSHKELGWIPPASYLREKGIVRLTQTAEPREAEAGDFKASARAELTLEHFRDLAQLARQDRMQQRQLLAARVLAGLVALLVVATGYLRLEDATRGYYTTLLRLGAGGALALVAAALFLVR
jgi:hypothetical protein